DRSSDGSLEVLRGLTDPRLRVVALGTNLGPAGAAQRAMDLALGEYIVRMDADDLMFPDRLERQVAYMDAHPEVGASGGQVVLFGDESSTWGVPLTNDECKAQLLFGVPIPQGGSILRTRVLRDHTIRYQDDWPRIGEDWLFWVALARHTRFGNIDAPVIRYRRGPQNISHGQDLVAARRVRVPLVLRSFGLDPTPDEVEAHLVASLSFTRPPDAAMVGRVHRWLDRLRVFNREAGIAPEPAIEARLRKAWDDLFPRLPERGLLPVFAHMRLSGSWSWSRWSYALKVRARVLLGTYRRVR
ncbi:MAG: glycosyltransferase family 2 protein, partial [Flavobacteriales bacterium]